MRAMWPKSMILLGLLALLASWPSRSAPAQPALVFDMNTGRVLLAHEAGRRWHPASLTKLMTAWLVMEAVDEGKLRWNQRIGISAQALRSISRGAARYGLKPGQRTTVRKALTFLMVRSDADMALALAEAVAGSEAAFVRRMNAAARALGMSATRFTNSHGLHHPRQITTARDMALLARAIHHRFLRRKPGWWRFFSLRQISKTVMRNGKPRTLRLQNRNRLLFMMPEANGMKTGFVCASGFNLLGTARRGDKLLGAVVLGRKTGHTRASVTRILLEEGFLRARRGGRAAPRLSELRNGGAPAPNLKPVICLKQPLRMVKPDDLGGWAAMFPGHRRAVFAEAVADAELLAAGLGNAGIPFGVMPHLPGVDSAQTRAGTVKPRPRPGWSGLIWKLSESRAATICARARLHKVDCRLLSPAELASLAPRLASRLREMEQRQKRLAALREKRRQATLRKKKNFHKARKPAR